MSRPIRSTLGVVFALFVSGCALPAPGGVVAPVPEEVQASVSPELRPCLVASRMEKPGCYEAALLGMLERAGVEAAIAALEASAEADGYVKREGHQLAHAVGLAALTTPESVGATFARCTPSFQSGCYHGVIQAYFDAHAAVHGDHLDAETVEGLCRAHRGDDAARWLLFQCAHGLGHGVTALRGYELPAALGACDLLADLWEREACYGGVFMESIVQATTPHHAVGRPQMAGAAAGAAHGSGKGEHHGAGHDHAAAADPSFPPLDPARPLYPCTVLEARYLLSCYQMQTSPILFFNGGDFAAAAAACDQAPRDYRRTCYQSLGRDASAFTLQDHAEAVRLCSVGDAAFRPWCHVGYAKNLVDLTARVEDGLAYCRQIPDAEGKRHCYGAMGEQLWALGETEERRAGVCAQVEAGYVEACRAGADLAGSPPAAPVAGGRAR